MNSKRQIYTSSLYGGLVIAGIWNIPGLNFINAFCCIGTIAGSVLAVYLFKQEIKQTELLFTKDNCLQVGIFTGIFGAVASSFLSVLIQLIFGNLALDIMMQLIPLGQVELPPFFYDIIIEARNERMTLLFALPSFILGSIFYVFIITPFTIIGGLIAWGLFKENN